MIENILKLFTDIVNHVNRKYSEYRSELDKIMKMWNEYKSAVNNVKKNWDVDSIAIYSRINQLKTEIDVIKEQLELLKVKRELELIDEETYTKSVNELNEVLSRITSMYDDLIDKYETLEIEIKEHWIRSMDVITITIDQVDTMIKDLEDAKQRQEIPEELYERLRNDLEMLRRVIQAISLVRIERKER